MAVIKGKVLYKSSTDSFASEYAGRLVTLFDITDGNYKFFMSDTSDESGDYEFSFICAHSDKKFIVSVYDDIGDEWTPNAALIIGNKIRPSGTLFSGYVYEVDSAGNAGITEPEWPQSDGVSVNIGAATAVAVEVGSPQIHGPIFIERENYESEYSIFDQEKAQANITFVNSNTFTRGYLQGSTARQGCTLVYENTIYDRRYIEYTATISAGVSPSHDSVLCYLGFMPGTYRDQTFSGKSSTVLPHWSLFIAIYHSGNMINDGAVDICRIRLAADFIIGRFWLAINDGEWNGSIDAGTGGNGFDIGQYVPFISVAKPDGTATYHANTGQEPFYYDPPDGFVGSWSLDRAVYYTAFDIENSSESVLVNNRERTAVCSASLEVHESTFSVKSVGDGMYYLECTINAGTDIIIGVVPASFVASDVVGDLNKGIGLRSDGKIIVGGSAISFGSPFIAGDVIGLALNMDSGELYFSINGEWQNSSDPETETSPAGTGISGPHKIAVSLKNNDSQITFNFGYDYMQHEIPANYIQGIAN